MKTIYRMHGNEKMFNLLKKYHEEGLLKVDEVRLTTWKNGDPKHIFVVKETDLHTMLDKVLMNLKQVSKDCDLDCYKIWVESTSDNRVEHKIEFLDHN